MGKPSSLAPVLTGQAIDDGKMADAESGENQLTLPGNCGNQQI